MKKRGAFGENPDALERTEIRLMLEFAAGGLSGAWGVPPSIGQRPSGQEGHAPTQSEYRHESHRQGGRLMGLKDIFGGFRGKPESGAKASKPSQRRPLSQEDVARQQQFREAASGYQGVLNQEFAQALESADEGLKFPENADDVLMYLGNLEPLGLSDEERTVVRHWTEELVEERGERAVWSSRLRLKLELRYLISEAGLQKRPGRS